MQMIKYVTVALVFIVMLMIVIIVTSIMIMVWMRRMDVIQAVGMNMA